MRRSSAPEGVAPDHTDVNARVQRLIQRPAGRLFAGDRQAPSSPDTASSIRDPDRLRRPRRDCNDGSDVVKGVHSLHQRLLSRTANMEEPRRPRGETGQVKESNWVNQARMTDPDRGIKRVLRVESRMRGFDEEMPRIQEPGSGERGKRRRM
mmetsp:Transcript_24258/g.61733  ORF Transcript_24258/g.61733 Transcript_24258/m.61733 type:complete len:152 (-) Transcript_24258:46-501(-)